MPMTDEEFERWKEENGWHSTAGDTLLILVVIALLIACAALS